MALVQTKLKTASADGLAMVATITDLSILTELVTALGRSRNRAEARAALQRALRG